MNVSTLFLAFAILLFGALVWRLRLSFASIMLMQLALKAIGLWVIYSRGQGYSSTVAIFSAGLLAVAVGYVLSSLIHRSRQLGHALDGANVESSEKRSLPEPVVFGIVLATGALALYHLVASGIPLFADSIERARFDFTSSGLFGVPGRMFLFGTTFTWILASSNATSRGVLWRQDRSWCYATFFLVATSVLSGFKGEALSVLTMALGVSVILAGPGLSVGGAVRRYWWVAGLAAVYFYFVAGMYGSYVSSAGGFWQQIIERFTVIGAEPGQYVIEGRLPVSVSNVFVSDASYFLTKYLGMPSEGAYSLDQLVSSSILGVSPLSSAFYPPVTVGGIAESYYSLGLPGMVIAMAAVGYFLGILDSGPRSGTLSLTARAIVAYTIYTWMLKGGGAYLIINSIAVLAMLAAVGLVVSLFNMSAGSRAASAHGQL